MLIHGDGGVTRSHNAHAAFEHVDELRNSSIDILRMNAPTCYAGVVARRRRESLLAVFGDRHRTEFVDGIRGHLGRSASA
jgi:hypothetical protein